MAFDRFCQFLMGFLFGISKNGSAQFDTTSQYFIAFSGEFTGQLNIFAFQRHLPDKRCNEKETRAVTILGYSRILIMMNNIVNEK